MIVVRDFCGHGLGRVFHAPPNVLHYGRAGTGPRLEPGMFFTIEPMVNLGRPETKVLADDWTAVTRDKSLSAQFEHSVGVTEDGCEIFTLSPGGRFHPTWMLTFRRRAAGRPAPANVRSVSATPALLRAPMPRHRSAEAAAPDVRDRVRECRAEGTRRGLTSDEGSTSACGCLPDLHPRSRKVTIVPPQRLWSIWRNPGGAATSIPSSQTSSGSTDSHPPEAALSRVFSPRPRP